MIRQLTLILLTTLIIFVNHAQRTDVKLYKSDTAWLNTTQIYIKEYKEIGYNMNTKSHYTYTAKTLSFWATNKMTTPTDKKLAYYYKKSPEAFEIFTKARKLRRISNIAFFTPITIILGIYGLSIDQNFNNDPHVPLLIYGLTSFTVFFVLNKKSTKVGYKAVDPYNKFLNLEYGVPIRSE